MKIKLSYIVILLFSFIGTATTYAQTLDEIKKEADELFEKKQFLEAKKKYLKLISSQDYARNPEINFKYGVCLLYSSGDDKKKAITHLSFAVKKPGIDHRAFYYLGKAYHLNYEFNNALKYYQKFKAIASTAELKKYNVDIDINACNNGKKLLNNITNIIVLEKTEIREEDFYELYKLNNIGGNILVTDQFQSKYDKKVGHRPVIHFPSNSPYIYYSSYGENGATGLDIYVQKKLPNGSWALPQKVYGSVNTDVDEDFPYMSPNGQYLYFCSKGHNSMGGYDVFRSRYNSNDNTFDPPENMDFAICSPDDDLFYVVDSLDRLAYFSSKRESEQGKVFVYKVRVEKIPMQLAVVKGEFINQINPNNKVIEFIINDFSNGAEIGKFKSKSKDGDFLLTFPKSGKYTFTMTVDGESISHQAVVTIPYLKEFRPLKMKVTHYADAVNGNTIKVEPLFDERFDNPTEILADVYRQISELNPNANDFDLDSLDKMRETDQIFVDAGLDPYTTKSDVEKVVQDRVYELENQLEANRKNTNIAYHLTEENSKQAQVLVDEAEALITQAENENDLNKKNNLLQEAFIKKEQAIKKQEEAKQFLTLAETIQTETVQKKQELIQAKQTLVQVKSINEGDRSALLNVVEQNQEFFSNQVKNVDNITVFEQLEKEGSQKQTEFSKLNDEIVQLYNNKTKLQKENEAIQYNIQNAKKKKEKDRLQKILDANLSELDLINQSIKQKEEQVDILLKSKNETTQLSNAVNKVKDPSYDNINYTKSLTDEEKNRIRITTNSIEINKDISKIEKVLVDNNIKGQYVSITGLDESRTDLTSTEWATAYDNEINALEAKLNTTTDPIEKEKIKGEIVRLSKAKENKIQGTAVTENTKDIIKEYELIPEYDSKIEKIASISNENERRLKENELNQELLDKIEYERIETQRLLDNNPGNVALKNKLNALNTAYDKAEKNIQTNESWLAENGTKSTAENSNTSEVLNKAYPKYSQKVNEIYESELSPTQKDAKIKELNESTLNSVEEKIQENQAILINNPNDVQAQQDLKTLEQIKTSIESNSKQPIIEPTTVKEIDNLTAKVSRDDLLTNYSNDLNKIENSEHSKLQNEKEKIVLNQTILRRINQQINEISTALNNNPTNKKTLEKRLNSLEALKLEVSNEIKVSKEYIDNNSDQATAKTGSLTVETINPDYVSKMTEIEKIEDRTAKLEAIKNLNLETLALIENQIDAMSADATKTEEVAELETLKSYINTHLDQAVDANELSRRYGNISSKVSPNDLLTDYDQALANITDSDADDSNKAEQHIELNNKLIDNINIQTAELQTYLKSNPSNQKEVEKRLANLEQLKAEKQAENENLKVEIDSKTPITSITIGDLVPDYEYQKSQIEKSNESVPEKIKMSNSLDEKLISKIDLKIDELEQLKASQPNYIDELNEQISKLEELKEVKQSEISKNNEILASIHSSNNDSNNSKIEDVTSLTETNFTTEAGKETFKNITPKIDYIKTLNKELNELEDQKNNTQSEKEKEKLEKEITKKETKIAILENEVIEDIEQVNYSEISNIKTSTLNHSINASTSGKIDADFTKADELVNQAESKTNEARLLREEAKNEKSPILTNHKLKRALVLEEESKSLLAEADRIYKTAIVVNQVTNSNPTVVEVSKNENERQSNLLLNQAQKIELEANKFEQKAIELTDSSNTVKKKYKEAILIEAQRNEEKANELRVQAQEIKEKAKIIKEQEDEILSVKPIKSNSNVDEIEQKELASTNTYKFYYGSVKQGDEAMAKAIELEKQINEKTQTTKRIIKQAIVVGSDNNSIENDPEIRKLKEEIEALRKEQEIYKNQALSAYNDANRVLEKSNLTDASKENIKVMASNNNAPVYEEQNSALADFTPPTKLNKDIFRTTDSAVYKTVKDIPVDEQQPEGLVYKVQIGAFRNEPSKDYFEKFAPISGQKLDNGITRYMVGYFTTYDKADVAKNQVRGMGDYKDAFVVAYYNGKKITIAEAKAIEAGGVVNENNQFVINEPFNNTLNTTQNNTTNTNTDETNATETSANNQENTPNNVNKIIKNKSGDGVVITPQTNEEKQLATYYTQNNEAAPANQVELMKGLFFTVQIGVYSKPVSSDVLFNIKPLNSQLTENGKIRYTTGIYNSVTDATIKKQEIIDKGIKDAFVTAYYNGNRITIAEAQKIIEDQGEKVLFLNGGQAKTETINNNFTENTTINNKETSNNSQIEETNQIIYQPEKLYFKLLIGTFNEKVPTSYNKYIFNDENITYEPELKNNKIYLLSSKLDDLDHAKELMVELNDLGLENMQLITYYDGKPIPFEEGMQIKNNNFEGELTIFDEPKGINGDRYLYFPEAVYYKVKMTFEGEIPVELANKILLMDPNTYTEELDENGHSVYYSTPFKTYKEALEAQQNYINEGFDKAIVVAYHKYNEISIEKAKAIKGE